MVKMSLSDAINQFEKFAQTMSFDNSLVDSIKNLYGKAITQDAAQFLGTRAVSSIPISIDYQKPHAAFEVDATGADSATVNAELKAVLDKKYGGKIGQMIAAKSPNEAAFKFGLFTVE
jgi:hypothetical protein